MAGAPPPATPPTEDPQGGAHGPDHGDAGGFDTRRFVMVAAGAGLAAFVVGAAVFAMLAPAPPPPPPEPPPPPVIEPTNVDLPDLMVHSVVGKRKISLGLRISLEVPTKGAALIIQSRLPAFREEFVAAATAILARSGSTLSANELKKAAEEVANGIIARTSCDDLDPATRAQGCTPGSEMPVRSVVLKSLMSY